MMDFLHLLLDFILHIDKYLNEWVSTYQTWTYLILFIIIFCETGLVVTPFLPGDSLLFAAGTIAAMDGNPLNVTMLIVVILIAAFAGDNTNFFIGRFLGKKVYEKNYKLIKREYIDKTHAFYEKHGPITIVVGRFMPFIRTFAPFIAGAAQMSYPKFATYNVGGGILWVGSLTTVGYMIGEHPWVKANFSIVALAMIIIPGLPALWVFKHFSIYWKLQ